MKFGEKKQVVLGAECNPRKTRLESGNRLGESVLTLNSWQFSPFELTPVNICTWECKRIWNGVIYFSFNLQLSESCLGQKCNNFDGL